MGKRRGNNEGSIYQRKDGRWVGQVQVGYKSDGSRKLMTCYGKTRADVSKKIANTLSDISKNIFVDTNQMTVEEWIWNWLKSYKKGTVKPNTYARYIYVINDYIVPALGKIKLKNLTSLKIQNLYNDCKEKGLSPSSIKHVHTILSPALTQAVKEGIITTNPAYNTTRPSIKKANVNVFTVEQQELLVASLFNDTMGVLIKLALATGGRIGELLGLKWEDVDFEKLEITFKQGIVNEYDFDDENHTSKFKKVTLNDLKTDSSERTIPITKATANMLREYKLNQRSYLKQVPANITIIPEMVFLNEAGNYLDNASVRKRYKTILKNLGIPYIKFHALRHTFATRVLEANIHPKIAQTLLGHSEMRTTMEVYSHVLPDQKRMAIEKISGVN